MGVLSSVDATDEVAGPGGAAASNRHDQRLPAKLPVRLPVVGRFEILSGMGQLVIFDQGESKPWEEKLYRREESLDGRPVTVWGA